MVANPPHHKSRPTASMIRHRRAWVAPSATILLYARHPSETLVRWPTRNPGLRRFGTVKYSPVTRLELSFGQSRRVPRSPGTPPHDLPGVTWPEPRAGARSSSVCLSVCPGAPRCPLPAASAMGRIGRQRHHEILLAESKQLHCQAV
jgi:hypothetical protein